MFGNLKYGLYIVIAIAVGGVLLTGNNGSSGASTAQLDRALGIASGTVKEFENTADVNENNAMEKFAAKYGSDLNSAQPPLNANPIGVESQANGAILSFDDVNSNGIKDEGEKDLFTMEVDSENSKLIASTEGESRQSGFSGSGLLMGMMIGNMLSRQRATGTNPAARKATAKGTPSARKRSGSGSHSRGK